MQFKKQIACISAVLLLGGGICYYSGTTQENTMRSYANQFGDINGDGEINATDVEILDQYVAYHDAGGSETLEAWLKETGKGMYTPEYATEAETETDELTENALTDEGDTLTVLCWSPDDVQAMIEFYSNWYGNHDIQVVCRCLSTPGFMAAEEYHTYFNSGEDVDVYMAEPDWIRQFIDDPQYAMPLSELGITEADYANAYPYAVEQGKNRNGELMAAANEVCPGFYAYNTDLAQEYLGVYSPEQMQERVSDWTKFEETAEELKNVTAGNVKITATLDGMWNAFTGSTDCRWVDGNALVTGQGEGFLAMARRFVENGYVDPGEHQWTDTWNEMGKNGQTLGYFYTSWTLAESYNYYVYNSGNWNICRGPENFFWGGYLLCVSPTCDTKATTADFLRTLTVDTMRMETYMNLRNAKMGAGSYIANNREVMKWYSGSSSLLCGQDPYPVLDEAAQGVRWDSTLVTGYDADLKSKFFGAADGWYDEPDEVILERYRDHVMCDYPELS